MMRVRIETYFVARRSSLLLAISWAPWALAVRYSATCLAGNSVSQT